MRAYEFIDNLVDIAESASSGATSSGSVATVASPMGSVVKRMPTTPNLFGYIQKPKRKTKKKTKS